MLIGIVSKKILFYIKLLILNVPQTKEAGGIVPTSSTTTQRIGDALAIQSCNLRVGKMV